MRKIFSVFLVLALLVGVFGCAQKTTEAMTETSDASSESSAEDVSVAADEASDDSELEITSDEDDLGEPI